MSAGVPRDCEKLRERLPEYAEGRLAGRLRARVERHVSECARCAAEVEDLRTVIAAVRAVPLEETPEDLVPRVRRAIQEEAPAPAGARLLWARLAVPVAVLTVLVAVSFALRAPKRQVFVPGLGAIDSITRGPVLGEAKSKQLADDTSGELGIEIARKMEATQGAAGGAAGLMAERPAPAGVAGPMAEKPAPVGAAGERESLWYQAHPSPPRPAVSPEPSDRRDTEAPARSRDIEVTAAPGAGMKQAGSPAERRPKEQLGRPGGAGRGGGGAGPVAAAEADGFAGAFYERGEETGAPPPPLSATAALVKGEGGSLIALRLAAEEPLHEITLTLGEASPQNYVWQGRAGEPAWVPLPGDTLGRGPAVIPIALKGGEASRDYVLFVPMMARLGESAPAAPIGAYSGQSLEAVLAEFTALTGVVVLAERPLDVEMRGEIPRGKPGEALEQLAAEAGFEAHREGDLAYTLTHRR